ncbi:MAG: ABC transporter ATP-binding protein [Thiotrichales bacterium]|jgi:lipopolysaccharide transport system ATP-binding protein|nr:ABC transporter ATP-binding protein [Gammaproteobacteria bacterium]MBT4607371.1 ABC transporter ATP-binding protein [Thiotrichales bacterium]MBT7913449.1 ABC transporter ATP-binding protein [Candidatus Bathyarchaeota archaeon]
MSSDVAVRASGLGKSYALYARPLDRLKQLLWGGKDQRYYQSFDALDDINLEIKRGDVLGIIGANGAGKSTLLQLVCGTLSPSAGTIETRGKIAALLELGAGFNPEFSGRENIFLAGAIQGLSRQEVVDSYDEIVAFSGIEQFIDQPVKTYSSGMYMRLAFSVATSVNPEILVIDEALSVGDGAFARKSFDRIMALRDAGKTVLFCSHSLYQVEALCNRAVWLDQGKVAAAGTPSDVVVAYNQSLAEQQYGESKRWHATSPTAIASLSARFRNISLSSGNQQASQIRLKSQQSDLKIECRFDSDPSLPSPSVAIVITDQEGRNISSAGTVNDKQTIIRDAQGAGKITLLLPNIPLLKGHYWIHCYLMCEQGIHFYEHAAMVGELEVTQSHLELGVVSLPHEWVHA